MTETNGLQAGSEPRAMRLRDFCARYGVSRSKAYREIRANRLAARKIGARTVILVDEAERWLSNLPGLQTGGR